MADVWATPVKDWANLVALPETDLDTEIRDRMTAIENLFKQGYSASRSAIWHAHEYGLLSARPTTNLHAGMRYYASDLGVDFICNGTRWDICGVNSRICEHIFDEFWLSRAGSGFITNAAGELLPWAIVASGSGAQFQQSGAGNRTRLNLNTGGGASGNTITMAPVSTGTHYQMNETPNRVPAIIYDRLQTVNTTDQTVLFGLADGGTATPNGIYFKRVDAGGVGNWHLITRAAGANITDTDTGVAGDANFHDFEIVIESLTSVRGYIDGTAYGPNSTNATLQGLDLSIQFFLTNGAAAQKQVNRDRFDMWSRRQ